MEDGAGLPMIMYWIRTRAGLVLIIIIMTTDYRFTLA